MCELAFIPVERDSVTRGTGPRSRLCGVEKICCFCCESNPNLSVV
jgi:hypothetical protein